LPAGAGGRRHARVRRLLPPFVPAALVVVMLAASTPAAAADRPLRPLLRDAAFWPTGRREVRSSYGDPPLLHRTALGRRFAQLLEGAS